MNAPLRTYRPPAAGTQNHRSSATTRVTPFAHLHIGPFANSIPHSTSHTPNSLHSSNLSVWLSVDPMCGKYPSFSSYVYCADNPVRCVDPNGEELIVANDEVSQNDILSIVNDFNRDRVTFDESGRVHINMADVKTEDAGLTLLNNMERSDKKFYYEASDIALHKTENGERTYTDLTFKNTLGCLNASNNGLDSKCRHSELPMDGYDGQVVISKTGYFSWGTINRRKNVVFHELAENFLRTDKGMNYCGPIGEGAHNTAKRIEYKAWGTIEAGSAEYSPIEKHFSTNSPMFSKVLEYLLYVK